MSGSEFLYMKLKHFIFNYDDVSHYLPCWPYTTKICQKPKTRMVFRNETENSHDYESFVEKLFLHTYTLFFILFKFNK